MHKLLTDLTVTELRDLIRAELQVLLQRFFDAKAITNSNSIPQQEYIFIEDVMKILGIAKQSVYGRVHRGELPSYKQGKRLIFRRSEIIAIVENGRIPSKGELSFKAESEMIEANHK